MPTKPKTTDKFFKNKYFKREKKDGYENKHPPFWLPLLWAGIAILVIIIAYAAGNR